MCYKKSAWQGPPSKGRQGKDEMSQENDGDYTEKEALQGGSVAKGGERRNIDTSSTLKDSHEAPDQMGNQEAESGDNTKDAEPKGATSLNNNSNAQAERTIGASAARILGPQEGEPKGAYTSDTKGDAEPKGATSLKSHKNAQAERPIGASASLGP